VAFNSDNSKLLLFTFENQHWIQLSDISAGYPNWSRDGEFVYFRGNGDFYRVRIRDQKLEHLASLNYLRTAFGAWGPWFGLGPDDSPMLVRDVGSEEIYALDWQAP